MISAQKIAQKLLQIKAIKLSPQNPFTWASGMRSPIYCDNRITLSHPSIRLEIKEELSKLCSSFEGVNHVSGVATAGIAHGALVADYLNLPFSYVRSSAKKHGRQNKIEGEIRTGSKIVVVEDLISTGGSSLEAVQALLDEGHDVLGVIAIFTYGFQIAEEAFLKMNIPYLTVSNYPVLIEEAVNQNYIDEDAAKVLNQWSHSPKDWYDRFYNN